MTGAATPPPPRSPARNAALSFATQLTTAALTTVLTLFLVRALDPRGYGLFALAVSIGGLLLLPADFGINNATARLVAAHRHDLDRVRSVFVDAVRLKLAVAGAFGGALLALAGPIASAYGTPGLAWPLRAVAIAVVGQTMLGLLGTTAVAMGRAEVNLRVVALESVLEVGASIALVLAGAGTAGAAWGRAIGYVVGFAIGLAVLLRFLGRPTLRGQGTTFALGRQIAGYAGALLIIDGAFTLYSQVDVLLVGAFLGPTAVGVFQAPGRLLTFLHYPGFALADGIAPRYARSEGEAKDPAMLATGLRVVVILQLALIVPTVVWARPIVELLLGSDYHRSAAVLAALAPFGFLQGIGPLISISINYAGEARRRVPVAIVTVLVDAAIGVVLIPRIGVVGGAISTDVAYGLYVAAHLWMCRTVLGLPLRPLAGLLVRASVAGAAMAGVLLAFGTDQLDVADWLLGGTLAVGAYVLALLATGAVTRAELLGLRLPRVGHG